MKQGELLRLGFVFGALGIVPVFLAGWLGYVQVAQGVELKGRRGVALRADAATAERQGQRVERTPAPRGAIVDRNGKLLACDREIYDARISVAVPPARLESVDRFVDWIDQLARKAAQALANDAGLSDRGAACAEHEKALKKQLYHDLRVDELRKAHTGSDKVPQEHPGWADIRLGQVEALSVTESLRGLGDDPLLRRYVTLHLIPAFQREYPDRDLTTGFVGRCREFWVKDEQGNGDYATYGVSGLETLRVLGAGEELTRDFLRDGGGRSYYVAPAEGDARPPVLHTTLDLELQRIATDELTAQAVSAGKDGKAKMPKWGALVLVEVATGDVVAAASWHRDAKESMYTPYQSLFEPGSVVKPLVCSYAYEAGVIDWDHVYDCSPGGADYRQRIAGLGRKKPVRDDHACGDLTPHGIIVNSSNIGATFVGLELSRDQWRDYMRFFGFGEPLGLELPHGSVGGWPRTSFDPKRPLRSFQANSAISFSFGYEFQVTAMHVARAYLRLLRGTKAELRVVRGIELGGQWLPVPEREFGGEFSPRVYEAVRDAMVDVLTDDPHATGRQVHNEIQKDLGIELHGLVAGKTGTAVSNVGVPGVGTVSMRNASFVGFLPAMAPRWLAVCVLQRDDSAHFYGGSYAAPPAVRLLLRAEQHAARHSGPAETRPPVGQNR